jgi:hypothetical protein
MPFGPLSPDVLPSPDLLPGLGGEMVFTVQITDLFGNVLTWTDELGGVHDTVEQYSNLSFTCPISDSRSASLTLSLYNPFVQHLVLVNDAGKIIGALARMVRIKYRSTTRFWGFITTPKYSTERATVEINCIDPGYRLRHRQLNLSDDVVGPSEEAPVHNPSDWTTMKKIVDAAKSTPDQFASNIPDIGIDVEHIDAVTAPDAFWTDIQRGSNNWDKLTEISEGPFGAEFDIVPYDPAPGETPFDTTPVLVVDP